MLDLERSLLLNRRPAGERNFGFSSTTLVYALSAFFIVFLGLFVLSQVETRRIQKEESKRNDLDLIFRSVEAGAVQFAQAHASRFANDYLAFQFGRLQSDETAPRILGVQILSGPNENEIFSSWKSPAIVPPSCLRTEKRSFSTVDAYYPYVVRIDVNNCFESGLMNRLKALSFVWMGSFALVLLLVLGGMLIAMLLSVQKADSVLQSSVDAEDVRRATAGIRWSNIRRLTQMAVSTRGKNLLYFQSLIEDCCHDLGKVLSAIGSLTNEQGHERDRKILSAMALVSRLSANPGLKQDEQPCVSSEVNSIVSRDEIARLLEGCAPGLPVLNELAKGKAFLIRDLHALERAILNLGANAIEHGRTARDTTIRVSGSEDGARLNIIFRQSVGIRSFLTLWFAFITKRIYTDDACSPLVYKKVFGREGRGLNIIKASSRELGGTMIFSLRGRQLFTGIDVPFRSMLSRTEATYALHSVQEPRLNRMGRRVMLLRNPRFKELAEKLGLQGFFVTKSELDHLLLTDTVSEVASDEELDIPSTVRLKKLSTEQRVRGLAIVWLSARAHPFLSNGGADAG